MASLAKVLEGVTADERAIKLMKKRPRVWARLLEDLHAVAVRAARGKAVRVEAKGYHDRDMDQPRVRLLFNPDLADIEEALDMLDELHRHLSVGEDWCKRTGEALVVGLSPAFRSQGV